MDFFVASRWKTRRRLFAPWFGKVTTLKNFVKTFEDQSNILVDNLEKHSKGSNHVDILLFLKEFAMDVVCGKFKLFRLLLMLSTSLDTT